MKKKSFLTFISVLETKEILKRLIYFIQILFQVGMGKLKPDLRHIRKDTPKLLKNLLISCIHTNSDERPLFPQVSMII